MQNRASIYYIAGECDAENIAAVGIPQDSIILSGGKKVVKTGERHHKTRRYVPPSRGRARYEYTYHVTTFQFDCYELDAVTRCAGAKSPLTVVVTLSVQEWNQLQAHYHKQQEKIFRVIDEGEFQISKKVIDSIAIKLKMITDVEKARDAAIEKLRTATDALWRKFPDRSADKQSVWQNFFNYYRVHSPNTTFLSRARLLEEWATDYMQQNEGQNPFSILDSHRRNNLLVTVGRFFCPTQTESMNLLMQFIDREVISPRLKALLNSEQKNLERFAPL